MQEIKKHGFKLLEDCFTDVLLKSPEKRKELHERIAERLKNTIDAEIGSRIEDSDGKIQSWQEKAVGEKGGYAAVRPLSGKNGGGTGKAA